MFGMLILIAMAVFFYKLAEFEDLDQPWLWAVLSIPAYMLPGFMGWGLLGILGGYGLLFVVLMARMTIIRKRQTGA